MLLYAFIDFVTEIGQLKLTKHFWAKTGYPVWSTIQAFV